MRDKLRVLIVEDDVLLSESLEIVLSVKGDMYIAGVARNGDEALSMLRIVEADIALVDLKMEKMDGVELIRHIREEYPGMKTLVLTTFYSDKDIAGAIQNGASGYILKGSGVESIIAAIVNVMAGRSVIDEKVMKRLSEYIKKNDNLSRDFRGLTKRELDICELIAKGYSNEQMAKSLFISEGTVKNHISSIYEKTGLRSRAKLTSSYIESSGLF